MKPIKSLLVLAIVCIPVLAAAQGRRRVGPIAPGGFHDRTGRITFGASVGLGGMSDGGSDITSCNCDVKPFAFEGDFHIGGVLGPRFALMFEGQINGQLVDSDSIGDTVVYQTAGMIAGQFWIIPQLWIKGGLGLANLQRDDSIFIDDFGTGGAVMGALGVELLSAPNFAVELQGRLLQASYNSLDDSVTTGTIGIGLNWY